VVEQAVPPTDDERTIIPSNKRERRLYQFLWATTGLSKAGYIGKDGRGTWTITADGNAILAVTKDPTKFLSAVDRRYKEWI
jgi:restriction endonuclease Mrr